MKTAHQSRSYVYVDDVARASVRSVERTRDQLEAGETGVEKHEVASEEGPRVITIAERINEFARDELGREVDI